MYPSEKALKGPEVKAFMDYVVENYEAISEASQIVPMNQSQADEAKTALGSWVEAAEHRSSRAARRHPASARPVAAGART